MGRMNLQKKVSLSSLTFFLVLFSASQSQKTAFPREKCNNRTGAMRQNHFILEKVVRNGSPTSAILSSVRPGGGGPLPYYQASVTSISHPNHAEPPFSPEIITGNLLKSRAGWQLFNVPWLFIYSSSSTLATQLHSAFATSPRDGGSIPRPVPTVLETSVALPLRTSNRGTSISIKERKGEF